jgi:hypothetical protein
MSLDELTAPVSLATSLWQEWVLKVLRKLGLFAADADIVWDCCLQAHLHGGRGWHEFADLVTAIDLGDVDPRARVLTISSGPSFALLDGSTGAGPVSASRALEVAIDKAQTTGMAQVVIRHSQPYADLAEVAVRGARAGYLTCVRGNSGKATTAWSGMPEPSLSLQQEVWAIPQADRMALLSRPTDRTTAPVPWHQAGSALGTLLLTAGLSGTAWPWEKKRASAYGAGAEQSCQLWSLEQWAGGEHLGSLLDRLARTATSQANPTVSGSQATGHQASMTSDPVTPSQGEQSLGQGLSTMGHDVDAQAPLIHWRPRAASHPEIVTLPPSEWAAMAEVAQTTRIPLPTPPV